MKEGATKVSTTQQQRQKRSLLTGRSADPDVQDYPLRLLLGPVILKGSKPHHNDRTPSSSKENNERQMSKFWYAGLDGIWSTQDGGCKGNRKPGSVAGVDMLLGYPRTWSGRIKQLLNCSSIGGTLNKKTILIKTDSKIPCNVSTCLTPIIFNSQVFSQDPKIIYQSGIKMDSRRLQGKA